MFNENVQEVLKKFQDTKQRTWEDTEKNKWTKRGLQQTSKWNKGHYIKRDMWNKRDNTKYKRGIEQIYGKDQKKRIKQNYWK
jgi:sialic acid synthase SpsE